MITYECGCTSAFINGRCDVHLTMLRTILHDTLPQERLRIWESAPAEVERLFTETPF